VGGAAPATAANGYEKWKEEESRNFASLLFEENKFHKMGPTQGRSHRNSSFVFLCSAKMVEVPQVMSSSEACTLYGDITYTKNNVSVIYATIFVIFSLRQFHMLNQTRITQTISVTRIDSKTELQHNNKNVMANIK
jgi:hypothetical protein